MMRIVVFVGHFFSKNKKELGKISFGKEAFALFISIMFVAGAFMPVASSQDENVNDPPVFSDESIRNGSIDVCVDILSLNVIIGDPDGDSFNWSIEASPVIGSAFGSSDSDGLKSCNISNLDYSTIYTWFVNATDGGGFTNESYCFSTESIPLSSSSTFYDGWYEKPGNYSNLVNWYLDLEKNFSDYMHVFKANELYGTGTVPDENYDLYYVRITNESLGFHKPEALFLGGTHGDESIGTIGLYWFADWLMRHAYHPMYNDDPKGDWLRWLIDNREIYIEICHNPWGFDHRELDWPYDRWDYNGWDLNREADYDSGWVGLWESVNGRTLRDFVNNHTIRVGCDMHAGNRLLMYPWSSTHNGVYETSPISNQTYAYVPPDFYFYDASSLRLGNYLGACNICTYEGQEPYGCDVLLNASLIGPFGDVMGWSAKGSFGQWAYGSNINKSPAEDSFVVENSPGAGICWVTEEISYKRDPTRDQLGNDTVHLLCSQIRRYLLHQIDLAQPYVRWLPGTVKDNLKVNIDDMLTFRYQINGSLVVDNTSIQWGTHPDPINNPQFFTNANTTYAGKYYGGTGWDNAENETTNGVVFSDNIAINEPGDYYFVAKTMVDQIYKNVSHQEVYGNESYLRIIQERTNESYHEELMGTDGLEIIDGQLWWYSPVIHVEVVDEHVENNPPSISEEFPNNRSIEVPLNPILSVDIADFEGDSIILIFQTNTSGVWETIGNYSGTNGTHTQLTMTMNETNHTYFWCVCTVDPMGSNKWSNETFSFTTTKPTIPPVISDVYPDGEDANYNPRLSITAQDPHGKNITVTFRSNATGVWQTLGIYNGGNGTYIQDTFAMDVEGQVYYWSVNVSNDNAWVNETYSFTAQPFVLKWTYNTGAGTYIGPLAVDVNGDGIYEVFATGDDMITCVDGNTGELVWNYNHGLICTHSPFEIHDLNNDGIEELVVASGLRTIALHANNGSVFWDVEAESAEKYLVIGDIEGNGFPYVYICSTDIYHGEDGTGRLRKLRGTDGAVLAEVFAWRPCWGGLSLADVDNDGDFELFMTDRNTGLGKGMQCYDPVDLTLEWNQMTLCSSQCMAIVDVNNDSILDAVSCQPSVCVVDGATGEKMPGKWGGTNTTGHSQFSIYDIDGDGNLELISCGDYPNLYAKVWDLGGWAWEATLDIFYEPPKMADVIGDGKLEIIGGSDWMGDPDDGSKGVKIYNSNYELIHTIYVPAIASTLVQDIDNDGQNELILISSNGVLRVYDTSAYAPTPRVRTNSLYYSERNIGAGVYVPPPGAPQPILKEEYPDDGSMNAGLNPTLSVHAIDFRYDLMNISISTNVSGVWENVAVFNDVGNGFYEYAPSNMDKISTTYYWRVTAVDPYADNLTTAKTYSFTTMPDAPVISNVSPADGEADVHIDLLQLSFNLTDFQGNLMNYTVETSPDIGSAVAINKGNGIYTVSISGLNYSTVYTWYVNVTDGTYWTNKSFTFTIESGYPMVLNPSPANGSLGVPVSLSQISFDLTDIQGDLMNYTVETSPDIGSAVAINKGNGRYNVSVNNLEFETLYKCYINVTDGTFITNETFIFKTKLSDIFDPFDKGWQYRKKITINHSMVEADLSDFPILIDMVDSDLIIHAQDDGDDIIFMNDVGIATKFSHEIERYSNSNGHLIAWVKIPILSSTADTSIYMYYGNPTMGNQQNATGVWNTNYIMIQHLEEISGLHFDSTFNNNDGTPYGALNQDVTGIIGGADEFGEYFDYIDLPKENMSAGQSEITLEFWINPDAWVSSTIWDEYVGSYWQYSIRCDKWFTRDNSTGSTGWRNNDLSLPTIMPGEWHHMAFVYSVSQSLKAIYLDGELNTLTNISVDVLTTGRDGARIGYASDGSFYDGMLDEVRVSHVAISPEWISTEYNTQRNPSSFYSVGMEENFETQVSYNISLQIDWNLISLPFNRSINKTDIVVSYDGNNYSWNDAVSNEIILGYIYNWNRSSQSYELIDTLVPGYGYNVYAYYDCKLLVETESIESDRYITDLKAEWNCIGHPDNRLLAKENLIISYNGVDYNWTQATTNDNPTGGPIILQFIYNWNRSSQSYELIDTLVPGCGYSIYSYYNCTLKKQ